MPSLYETTAIVGDVSSSNFTTLYNSSGLSAPNTGGGAVGGNLNVAGNLTVQGTSLLQGAVTLGSTLSTPNYTFPLPDGSTDQVLVTDGSGNLYWTDVTSIPGAAYSIEANVATGGANLTLVDSAGGTDSVKFASGTNITVSRTDANTITISTVADNIPDGTAAGEVLVWDGSAWTANNQVTSLTAAVRLTVEYKDTDTSRGSSAIFRRNYAGTAYSAGLLSAVAFQFDSDSQAPTTQGAIGTIYNATIPSIFAATSTDNFTTSVKVFDINSTDVKFNGANLVLNADQTGTPSLNAIITAERGSSTDATLTWNESTDRWEFSNSLYVTNNYSQDGDSMTINADNTAVDSYLYMKGSSEYLKWNNTETRFELSDQIYNTLNDVPAKFERQVLTSEINVPTESKTALRLLERVTDAPNNDTLVTGPGITFGRTSGATATTEQIYAQIGTSWDGTNDKVWMFFNGSTDNFNEPTPGSFPGSFTMLGLKTDEAYFKNNSLYINYSTPGTPYIGINTATPTNALSVVGDADFSGGVSASDFTVDGAATLNTQITTTTSTAITSISNTTRTTQKVVITITDDVTGELHVLEALAFQKGATAYLTTYGEMYSNAALATFTADVSAGSVRIRATPASANSTTFTVARISVD